jgi:hypothetical protein
VGSLLAAGRRSTLRVMRDALVICTFALLAGCGSSVTSMDAGIDASAPADVIADVAPVADVPATTDFAQSPDLESAPGTDVILADDASACAMAVKPACFNALGGICCDDVVSSTPLVCVAGQWQCAMGYVSFDMCCGFGPGCAPYPGRPLPHGCPVLQPPDAGH